MRSSPHSQSQLLFNLEFGLDRFRVFWRPRCLEVTFLRCPCNCVSSNVLYCEHRIDNGIYILTVVFLGCVASRPVIG